MTNAQFAFGAAETGSAGLRAARVTRVESIPVMLPLRKHFEHAIGGKRLNLENLIVRLYTDQGLVGLGETQAWRRIGSSDTLRGLKAAIDDILAPQLVGRAVFDAPAILWDFDQALHGSHYAKAPLADALLDLQGQLLGVPASALLGGQSRQSIPISAVLPITRDLQQDVEAGMALFERGFRSFVVKVSPDGGAVQTIQQLRSALPEAVIRLDANASMDFAGARRLSDAVADCDIEGFEQPLPPWDVEGMALLAQLTKIPIIADECVVTAQDLLRVIQTRAAFGFQSKVAKNGGAWRSRDLWSIGAAAGLKIYPGNHPGTSIVTASVAHLAAAWSGPLMEGPFAVGVTDEFAPEVVVEPLTIKGNLLQVPNRPGLGMTIDEKALEKYRIDR